MGSPPRLLYHFTSRIWLPFIKKEGITRGEAPISPTERLQHPNLTSNPDPDAQKWSGAEGHSALHKTAVRITVEIPEGDQKLISWHDFAIRQKMDRKFYRTVDESGGWEAKNWWLYQGIVVPEWFSEIHMPERAPITQEYQALLEACARYPDSQSFIEQCMVPTSDGNLRLDVSRLGFGKSQEQSQIEQH
jgi:hypothetical protein